MIYTFPAAIDLHVHSCLSPCGDLEMSPKLIAREARACGLGAVALCDHNSALNCPAFRSACLAEGLLGIYGLEMTTREELHVLCLFAQAEAALELGDLVYARLVSGPYDAERFGDQVYVDENEVILGSVEKHLIGAVDLSLAEAAAETARRGGIFVPAHIDRSTFSVSSQLGFLPDGSYDAVEITRPGAVASARGYPAIASSDAHFPGDIGIRHTVVEVEELSFEAIRDALAARRATPVFTRR